MHKVATSFIFYEGFTFTLGPAKNIIILTCTPLFNLCKAQLKRTISMCQALGQHSIRAITKLNYFSLG